MKRFDSDLVEVEYLIVQQQSKIHNKIAKLYFILACSKSGQSLLEYVNTKRVI